MVSATTGTEYILASKVAEEYRRKGYEVAREVALDFLPDIRADLIARKDDEVRVIEVKTRSSLAANPQIGEMARIVDEKRGWTFELRLVGEPHRSDIPKDGQPSKVTDVDERIDEAKRALAAGTPGGRASARMVGCGGVCEKGGCCRGNRRRASGCRRQRTRSGRLPGRHLQRRLPAPQRSAAPTQRPCPRVRRIGR